MREELWLECFRKKREKRRGEGDGVALGHANDWRVFVAVTILCSAHLPVVRRNDPLQETSLKILGCDGPVLRTLGVLIVSITGWLCYIQLFSK